jgi:hypothetical protein
MKIRIEVADLWNADGQTDMTKLTVAFKNFSNVPKITLIYKPKCYLVSYSIIAKERISLS